MFTKCFLKLFLVIDLQQRCQEHLYILSNAIRIVIVRQVTNLLLSNCFKNIVKKSIWKFIDIFPNQVLNFLRIFTKHEKIIADYTKSIERISQLLCRNVIIEGL